MRIALISDWFSEQMGYSENCLPKALAALGHEVHLVTTNTQPYFDWPSYAETYGPFIGPGVVPCVTQMRDGYTLHRLPHAKIARRLRIRGLGRQLAELQPEVVQTFDAMSLSTVEAAWNKPRLDYRLFLESHLHASVFDPERRRKQQRLPWKVYRETIGRFVSSRSVKCYAVSQDAREITAEFFGFPAEKLEICSLGVDTQMFRPPADASAQAARDQMRRRLGLEPDEVVCIYTGRFAPGKGPLILAEAVDRLVRRGKRFHALFVGGGTPAEVAALLANAGCTVHPFVPAAELPPFYWAADIGVWPRQESTSQLDAAACGLPIIISDQATVRDRVDGNGLTYPEADAPALARQIQSLAEAEVRRPLGQAGSSKMVQRYSWLRIASQRAEDYTRALAGSGRS